MRSHHDGANPRARQVSKRQRFSVLQRDRFACRYCGASGPGVVLHVDHVRPRAAGGGNDRDNLATACADCNLGKGALVMRPVPCSAEPRRYFYTLKNVAGRWCVEWQGEVLGVGAGVATLELHSWMDGEPTDVLEVPAVDLDTPRFVRFAGRPEMSAWLQEWEAAHG